MPLPGAEPLVFQVGARIWHLTAGERKGRWNLDSRCAHYQRSREKICNGRLVPPETTLLPTARGLRPAVTRDRGLLCAGTIYLAEVSLARHSQVHNNTIRTEIYLRSERRIDLSRTS